MQVDDVVGAAFLPTDGQANPSDITMALARGARHGRAPRSARTPRCSSIEVVDGVIKAVVTVAGPHRVRAWWCCCAGQWTRALAATVGVNVPLVLGAAPVRDHRAVQPDGAAQPADAARPRSADLLQGGGRRSGDGRLRAEPDPLGDRRASPADFKFKLLDADFDHFAPTMELAIGRVPALQTPGINELINGPESFTPDGNFILGEAPELKNFFVGAGFNAFGIAAGGGAGHGAGRVGARRRRRRTTCGWSTSAASAARTSDTDWVRTRTLEAYGKHYTMAWPFEEHDSGRPCRTSPLYYRLLAAGACFGEKLGWERPNWFADVGARRDAARRVHATDGRTGSRPSAASTAPCREAAVLIDQTSFAKFALKGPDALAALNWICANNVDKPVGSLTYTQMLDDSRRHPVRPDRVPGGRRRVLHRHRHRLRHARLRLDPAQHPRRRRTRSCSTSPRRSRAVADGAATRATILQAVTRADVSQRGVPVRHACRSSASPAARCGRCASPTSASSAGSCTCRSSTRRRCTTR